MSHPGNDTEECKQSTSSHAGLTVGLTSGFNNLEITDDFVKNSLTRRVKTKA